MEKMNQSIYHTNDHGFSIFEKTTHFVRYLFHTFQLSDPTSEACLLVAQSTVLADCEFLFLGFVGMDDEDYTAILFTATDTVVLCQSLSDETNLDHDGTDAIGIMTHSGFWTYLNSFPNCYKHMVSTSCSRHEYWVNKSKAH